MKKKVIGVMLAAALALGVTAYAAGGEFFWVCTHCSNMVVKETMSARPDNMVNPCQEEGHNYVRMARFVCSRCGAKTVTTGKRPTTNPKAMCDGKEQGHVWSREGFARQQAADK